MTDPELAERNARAQRYLDRKPWHRDKAFSVMAMLYFGFWMLALGIALGTALTMHH
jgi:hypothetical protein